MLILCLAFKVSEQSVSSSNMLLVLLFTKVILHWLSYSIPWKDILKGLDF